MIDDWDANSRAAAAFIVELTAQMTLLHVVQLAAREHDRRHGDSGGHIFFESIRVCHDHVIEFAMGS